jgi:SAM-dependent methyltransferase
VPRRRPADWRTLRPSARCPEDPLRRLSGAVELLDGPLDDPRALDGNLRDLARVNRWLGGRRLSAAALEPLVPRVAGRGIDRPVSLLDVGTGGADIPRWLIGAWQRNGRRLTVTAIDDRREVLASARRITPGLDTRGDLVLAVADGRELPYEDDSFDIAHCSLVLHHLDERGAVRLLREMARVARCGVVVNDLARGRYLWLGAWLLAHLATRNRLTRHDAPLSVRRAWSSREARALLSVAGLHPIAERHAIAGHRWAVVAVRW